MSARTTRAWGTAPPMVPQEQRTQWVFLQPCGCPRGVTEATRIIRGSAVTLTEDEAWDTFADTRADERALRREGVTAVHMSHARYCAEVSPLMVGPCPHRDDADPSAAGGEPSGDSSKGSSASGSLVGGKPKAPSKESDLQGGAA